jgi:hypothetical protein
VNLLLDGPYIWQDVGKTDAYGNTALLLAAERGHLDLTQLLIGQFGPPPIPDCPIKFNLAYPN